MMCLILLEETISMSHIKRLQRLLKNDKASALMYFHENLDSLFSKKNRLEYGFDLLEMFYELQQNFINESSGYIDYKKAVLFYQDHRHKLQKINIVKTPDNFLPFKAITELNAELEDAFHEYFVKHLEVKINEPTAKDDTNQMIDDIRFALELLDNSITKLKRNPRASYNECLSILRLRVLNGDDDSTSTYEGEPNPTEGAIESPSQVPLQIEISGVPRATLAKPPPPQTGLMSTPPKQVCIKSSAPTFFKPAAAGSSSTTKRKNLDSQDVSDEINPSEKKSKENPTAVLKNNRQGENTINVTEAVLILTSVVNTYSKEESADVLRELSRFARKFSSQHRLPGLIHSAKFLCSLAVAWGCENAKIELDFIDREYSKTLHSQPNRTNVLPHSSGCVLRLIEETLHELDTYMLTSPNHPLFEELFDQFINDSRFRTVNKADICSKISTALEGVKSVKSTHYPNKFN